MSLSIIRMRGECLVVASLQGFSDEALQAEIQRRAMTRTSPGGSRPAPPPSSSNGSCAQEDFNNGRAEIRDVIALADFDACALVDELQLRPNFKLMLQDQYGITLLTAEEMGTLTDACAQGSIERIRQAFKWTKRLDPVELHPLQRDAAPSSISF